MKINLGFKIWLLIFVVFASLLSMFTYSGGLTFLQDGVAITSVDSNSTAFDQGLRQGQNILYVDETKITSIEDYTSAISSKFSSREKVKTTIQTNEGEVVLYSDSAPEITVAELSSTNLELGLDLAGGARALVKAENKSLTQDEVNELVDITSNRLNEFGLTDLKVTSVSDLSGNNFMLIEIAGATPDDLEEMISQQGKFEAKIANETVFIGGEKDISSVCRSDSTCSGIRSCSQTSRGYVCTFQFSVYLSEEAAERHAEITKNIGLDPENPGYLIDKLDLYIDDNLAQSLSIGESLKGIATTQIAISGSGTGTTNDDAIDAANDEMHTLQTILVTGSLPYKLEIVKLDTISPSIGKQFISTILLAGVFALIAVLIVIFVRYRNIKSVMALLVTSLSEIIIILGIAAFINWNLDLPSIAGILATIGTGLDDLIVVLDESTSNLTISLKQRIKRAFAIILGAYFTTFVSLLPLMWAGAGLLKGFAITTLIGITAGVLITRPAFTEMIKRIEH